MIRESARLVVAVVTHPVHALQLLLPFLLPVGGFVVFVIWNDGIVLGP